MGRCERDVQRPNVKDWEELVVSQSVCQVYLARTLTLGRAGTGSSILSSFNFVLDRYRLRSLPENERVDLSGIAVTRAIVIAMCGYEGVVV